MFLVRDGDGFLLGQGTNREAEQALQAASNDGWVKTPARPVWVTHEDLFSASLHYSMHLHLLIPSLFWPDSSLTGIYQDLSLPALEGLLSKGAVEEGGIREVEAWLCDTFGIAKQQDWPVAPITLKADGREIGKTDHGYWLRADPVHLHIERDQLLLADSRVFRITPAEAEELTTALNRHFAESCPEIAFLPLHPARWYICLQDIPPPQTHLLSEVVNKGVRELLPYGESSGTWRKLFNETQMLLHEQPLNRVREANGAPLINSIWFWGGGIMPVSFQSDYTHVWGNHILAQALALSCGARHSALPLEATVLHGTSPSDKHLVVLDSLEGKASYSDAYGWRESLKELEKHWFQPLFAMVKQGKLHQLKLSVLGKKGNKDFTIRSGDMKKFWRTTKPISVHAD